MSALKEIVMNEQEIAWYETAVEIVGRRERSAQSARREDREERGGTRSNTKKEAASRGHQAA